MKFAIKAALAFASVTAVVPSFAASSLAASSFTTTELSIPSDVGGALGHCDLTGTLLLPSSQPPRAVVVFVHGSGPMNRDEATPQGHAPFREVAEYLAGQGVASYRFDKRVTIPGCRETVIKNLKSLSPSDSVKDVRNVSLAIQRMPMFSQVPFFLLAHSEGVNFVSELIANSEVSVRGVILLAGLGKHPIDETILRQLRFQAQTPGISAENRQNLDAAISAGESFFAKVHNGQATPDDSFMGVYSKYWSEWIEITGRAASTADKIDAPSLLLQGSRDINVTLEDFEALRKALSGNPKARAEIISDADHLFAMPSTVHIDERVLSVISEWLTALGI